ncbi:MAG: alpha/beta hydrolase family protein [Oligoflexales bacterium]
MSCSISIKIFFLTASLSYSATGALGKCTEQGQLGLNKIKTELTKRSIPNWQTWESITKTKTFEHIKGLISAEGPGQIPYDLYLNTKNQGQESNSKKPLVLIFPGFQGVSWIDHHIGKYFAKNGMHVLISHYRDIENDRRPEKIYEVTKNNIQAGMLVIDALIQLDEIDSEKIGLLGYSFGGIRGSFLALIDERIKAVNFIVSSGNFSKTILDSSLAAIDELRKEHMLALGSPTIEEYEKFLEHSLPFEPYQAICEQDYSHFFLVNSKTDTIVPSVLQDSFARQLTGAKTLTYRLGHIPSVLRFALRDLNKSQDFFSSVWGKKII